MSHFFDLFIRRLRPTGDIPRIILHRTEMGERNEKVQTGAVEETETTEEGEQQVQETTEDQVPEIAREVQIETAPQENEKNIEKE